MNTAQLPLRLLATTLLVSLLNACAARMIPNTDVEDNSDNRRVVEFVEQYRHAMEARNAAQILRLVSEDYYDDNGTPSTADDIDYSMLQERLGALDEELVEVHYEMRYRRVVFRDDRVLVDFTYTGRFKVRAPDGDRWARRLADNRLELVRDGDDGFRIISGL